MVLVSTKQRYVCAALSVPLKYNSVFKKKKLITLQTLLTILNTTKSTEISGVIKGLPLDTQDTLMKYLYKGMGLPGWGDISGSVLLGWHEKVSISFVECVEKLERHGKRLLTTTSLSHPSFLFVAVNRGCRSGMYCSSNDRSKNRVNY